MADNDTQGLPCPTNFDRPSVFPCPESVFAKFHLPATDRLLNYDSSIATHAAQSMRAKNNPHRLMQQVPAGLSQLSHLPSQESGDDAEWHYGIEEVSDTEDYGHSRKVLSRHYNDPSSSKDPSTKGLRLPMIPASSKRQKTHGTKRARKS